MKKSVTIWVLGPLVLSAASLPIEKQFEAAKKSPGELYAFLYRMPKGGDLQNHLSGAVYAETYIRAAAEDKLCIDMATNAIVAPPCGKSTVEASRALTDNTLASGLINSF